MAKVVRCSAIPPSLLDTSSFVPTCNLNITPAVQWLNVWKARDRALGSALPVLR